MLARLWWKEWRSLAPIMAVIIAAGVGSHWFLQVSSNAVIPAGTLISIALCWAVLYALVAGAASFAGEREGRTMGLLDALPVGRNTLWLGKVSFALGSSFGLALLFRLFALTNWAGRAPVPLVIDESDLFFALLVAEAAVWGLFWSAICKYAISAGILAVISTGLTSALVDTSRGHYFQPGSLSDQFLLGSSGQVVVLVLVLIGSWLILNRELAGRALLTVRSFNSGPWRGETPAFLVGQRLRTWPTPAFRSVLWQTIREGRTAWLQCVGLACCAVGTGLLTNDPLPTVTLVLMAVVIQGASVFGLENSAGTRAFLDHQAVRPGTVWAAKLTPWVLGLVVFGTIVGLATNSDFRGVTRGSIMTFVPSFPEFVGVWAVVANAFGVGVLGGMMFTRRITAALIAILGFLVIAIPQAALVAVQMIPHWTLILSPMVLLAASWCWAGDWLANRGLRRWVKLGGLTLVPYGLLAVIFVTGRAWGVPASVPQGGPDATAAPTPDLSQSYQSLLATIDSDRFHSAEYRDVIESGWATATPEVVASLRKNQPTLESLRQLAAGPGSAVAVDTPGTIFNNPPRTIAGNAVQTLVPLLQADELERRSRGDFAGAWLDVVALFQLSRQYATGARSVGDYTTALAMTAHGVKAAVAWSKDPNITVVAIAAARQNLPSILPPVSPEAVFRSEARRLERSLDQPAEAWVDYLVPATRDPDPWQAARRIYTSWVLVPSWERERARRFLRPYEESVIRSAREERRAVTPVSFSPSRQRAGTVSAPVSNAGTHPLDLPVDQPMIASLILPFMQGRDAYDRAVAEHRLLTTFLALRSWQMKHGGVAPRSLEELIPSELDALPADPFQGGGSFGYEADAPPAVGMAGMMGGAVQAGGMVGMMGGGGPAGVGFPNARVIGAPPGMDVTSLPMGSPTASPTSESPEAVKPASAPQPPWAPTFVVFSVGLDWQLNARALLRQGRPISSSDDLAYPLPRDPLPAATKP